MSIYLDYNATTPVDSSIVQAICTSLSDAWGNPSSNYTYGKTAKDAISKAQHHVARMINAAENDIIFTSGGTEANNMAIFSAVESFENWQNTKQNVPVYKPHVITSKVEHDAISLPLKYLESKNKIEVSYVPASRNGCVSVEEVISFIKPNTCLITIMFANNETGVIMPIAALGRSIHEINQARGKENLFKMLFQTDAAQAIGKIPVDVEETKVDYLTVVGHKFYGPRIGCLYARGVGVTTPLYPVFFGGGQQKGLRPGTENTPMICGLGKACELVTANLDSYTKHLSDMKQYLMEKLKVEFGNGIKFNCHEEGISILPNTCNVSLVGLGLTGPKVLANCRKIAASTGSACHSQNKPSAILINSGVSHELAQNAIRLSVGRETTKEEIDMAVSDLKQAVEAVKNES